jgi:hypothetical protein
MPTLKQIARKALDVLYDVTAPVAGTCPVCAFWRGVGAGVLVGIVLVWAAA